MDEYKEVAKIIIVNYLNNPAYTVENIETLFPLPVKLFTMRVQEYYNRELGITMVMKGQVMATYNSGSVNLKLTDDIKQLLPNYRGNVVTW